VAGVVGTLELERRHPVDHHLFDDRHEVICFCSVFEAFAVVVFAAVPVAAFDHVDRVLALFVAQEARVGGVGAVLTEPGRGRVLGQPDGFFRLGREASVVERAQAGAVAEDQLGPVGGFEFAALAAEEVVVVVGADFSAVQEGGFVVALAVVVLAGRALVPRSA
jgi:hypothetical protein